MFQNNLKEYNRSEPRREFHCPVVEVVDGNRKLRHLFLMDGMLVNAKPDVKEKKFILKWIATANEVENINKYFVKETIFRLVWLMIQNIQKWKQLTLFQ